MHIYIYQYVKSSSLFKIWEIETSYFIPSFYPTKNIVFVSVIFLLWSNRFKLLLIIPTSVNLIQYKSVLNVSEQFIEKYIFYCTIYCANFTVSLTNFAYVYLILLLLLIYCSIQYGIFCQRICLNSSVELQTFISCALVWYR